MSNSLQASEHNADFFITFKNVLIETIDAMFRKNYGLSIVHSSEQESCFSCKTVSSSIEFHGSLVGVVIMILDKTVARYLLQKMGLEALSPEEEREYIQDAMGELLNIVLGYTANELMDRDIAIGIEPPAVFEFNKQDMDSLRQNSWIYAFETEQGKCCLVLKNNLN